MKVIERLELNINEIKKTLVGSYLNKIECYNDFDYMFKFSYSKAPSVFISLNVKNPFIALINKRFNFNTITPFYSRLKSKLLNACLIDASLVNNDNILKLDFLKTTDTYDKVHYSLVFEIFKSNSNLILLSDGKIEDAFRFKGLDTHHPILKNMIYEAPEKFANQKEESEKDLENEKFYINSIERIFLSNKYKNIKIELKRKQKSLIKKLVKLKNDHDEAVSKLQYKDYADYFLTIMHTIKRGDSSFDFYGKEIKINNLYSPSENLNQLYKTYKKAKLTIQSTDEYIEKTEDEIAYIESVSSTFDYLNDSDYQELVDELSSKKIIKLKNHSKQKNIKCAEKPYYIIFNNVRIGFGKNAKQNNNLTFSLAGKSDYFIHNKNAHGNHVIIFDSNPTDSVIEYAMELCVFLSNQIDSEVIYTQVKTLKKGKEIGLVKLSQYESYTIKKINYDFASIVKSANRF